MGNLNWIYLVYSESVSYITAMLYSRLLSERIKEFLGYFPVTAILGPRQCGKTTLAKSLLKDYSDALYLDLEKPSDLARLAEPEDFLTRHRGRLICLDEIQRVPNLFEVMRSICDESGIAGQFMVLGSASPDLLRQSSETLAGRIGYQELTPFSIQEVGGDLEHQLWLRGGFPRSFLAPGSSLSRAWLNSFIQTFLERDIPQLGFRLQAPRLRKFWEMTAHLNGELWNNEKVAASLGVTGNTVRHYLDVLEKSYMLRVLRPFSSNAKKRLVKSPKVYIRDTGILHRLLRIEDMDGLDGHPVRGSSWEGYVIEQIAAALPEAELCFYRTAAGAEIDLLIQHRGHLYAIEIKASSSPKVSRGFWNALEDLQPDQAWIAAPVSDEFSIGHNVNVLSPERLCKAILKDKS